MTARKTFAFLSSCPEAWGGSEELWSGTAILLAESGHHVIGVKTHIPWTHPRIKRLSAAGVGLSDYNGIVEPRYRNYLRRILPNRYHYRFPDPSFEWLCQHLGSLRPSLTLISQGDNFDGLRYVAACNACQLPYVLLCQKASDAQWPSDDTRIYMRRAYIEAVHSYFVSEHNLRLTEAQIGVRLPNAEVVRNPFLTQASESLTWPETPKGVYRLACVARLFVQDKGQDILINVLAQPKWKERPLEVYFYGKGIHREGLEQMARLMGVSQAHFVGFVSDIDELWQNHHALILPSRCEGLPLALVEAMRSGRFGIVTNVGGNAEIVQDNKTGFLAASPSVPSLDEALERAWNRREEWESIGQCAAHSVRELLPDDPNQVFADKLLRLGLK